jgi:hypothetical protein
MSECFADVTTRILGSYNILACVFLVGLCIMVRKPKLIIFSSVLTVFYMSGFAESCFFLDMFKSNQSFRYAKFAFFEFMYVFVLVILAYYRKVRIDQVAYTSVITTILIFTYLIRMYDRVYFKFGLTNAFYKELVYAGNLMFVAIAYFPLFIMFYYKFIAKKKIPYSKWHE